MTRLRIAMLALYPEGRHRIAGGVRAVAYNLVQALKGYDDLELHVVHCHGDVDHDALVMDDAVAVHYLVPHGPRFVPNMVNGIRRIRGLLSVLQPDLVHAHIAPYAIAAQRAGYPTLFTVHGVVAEEAKAYTATWFDRLRYALYAYYDAQAVRHSTDLVAISDYVQQARAGGTHARWHRINNPIPDEFFVPGSHKREQGRAILFAGSITEVKDLETLLRAFALVRQSLPDARLDLAGRVTSPDYEQRLRAVIESLELGGSVRFLGLLGRESLLDAYAECAVVALSSLQENAPMAVSEAMAVGKPVVATQVGGVGELVEDGRSGYLVQPGDVAGIAERLTRLLGSPSLRESMGERGQEIARARFGAAQVTAEYRRLYYGMLGRPTPGEEHVP